MRVRQKSSTEDAIHERVERTTNEWCHGKRYDAGRDQSLEGPMVVSMGWTWFRDTCRSVDYIYQLEKWSI